jgi:hypothetical protein
MSDESDFDVAQTVLLDPLFQKTKDSVIDIVCINQSVASDAAGEVNSESSPPGADLVDDHARLEADGVHDLLRRLKAVLCFFPWMGLLVQPIGRGLWDALDLRAARALLMVMLLIIPHLNLCLRLCVLRLCFFGLVLAAKRKAKQNDRSTDENEFPLRLLSSHPCLR